MLTSNSSLSKANSLILTPKKSIFTQFQHVKTLRLSEQMPNIREVISVMIDPEILCLRVVNTIKGISCEGESFSGKMAMVLIKLNQKVLYSSAGTSESIHVIKDNSLQCIYVPLPCLIEGSSPDLLIKNKYLSPKIQIDYRSVKAMDQRTLFNNILLSFELQLKPSYTLCCAKYTIDDSVKLILTYQDGTNENELRIYKDIKQIKPLWSPSGDKISFLLKSMSKNELVLTDLRKATVINLVESSIFKSITSFCWLQDGHHIIFSASKEGSKELYSLDINTLNWLQLTYGNSISRSYRPKASTDGRSIAFLKSISGVSFLYLMSIDGLHCERISKVSHIRDFTWSYDSKHICYIQARDTLPDELHLIDIDKREEKPLNINDSIYNIRKIEFSPTDPIVIFIGSKSDSEDLYLYNFKANQLINLTKHHSNVHISSFTWKIDGTKVYYSSNELYSYNLYAISLDNNIKHQLTNESCTNMELSYRPKIV